MAHTFKIGATTYTVDRAFVYGSEAIEIYAVAGHNAPIKIAKMVGDPAYYFMPARKPARKIGMAHVAKLDAAARAYVAEAAADQAHAEAVIDARLAERLAAFPEPTTHAEAVARMRAIWNEDPTLRAGLPLTAHMVELYFSTVLLRRLDALVAAAYASPYGLQVGQRVRITTDHPLIVAYAVEPGTEVTVLATQQAPFYYKATTHVLIKLDDGREFRAHYAELDTI